MIIFYSVKFKHLICPPASFRVVKSHSKPYDTRLRLHDVSCFHADLDSGSILVKTNKHITGRMTMMSAQTDTAYIIVTGTTDMNLLLLEVSSC